MLHHELPSYEQSEAEAAAAMLASFNSNIEPSAPPYEADLPPSYDESEAQHKRLREYQARLNYQINGPEPSAPPPSPQVIQEWYQRDLEDAERVRLQQQYQDNLRDQQKYNEMLDKIQSQDLKNRLTARRKICLNHPHGNFYPMDTLDDFLLMQYMARDLDLLLRLQWRLNLFILEKTFQTASALLPVMTNLVVNSVYAGRALGSGLKNNIAHHEGEAGKAALVIGAVMLMLLAIGAGFIGAYYSVKKTAKAFQNIYNGKKLFASITRVTAAISGWFAGSMAGLVAGAVLSSMIPGFGSLAGAIIGCVAGGSIGTGLGVLITKNLLQFTSWLWNRNDPAIIQPTNPNKYRLDKFQQLRHEHVGTNTQRIHNMMKNVKNNKPATSILFTHKQDQELNADYNQLLTAVKNQPWVTRDGFYFAKNNLFTWNQIHKNWQRSPVQAQPGYRPR